MLVTRTSQLQRLSVSLQARRDLRPCMGRGPRPPQELSSPRQVCAEDRGGAGQRAIAGAADHHTRGCGLSGLAACARLNVLTHPHPVVHLPSP